MASSTPFTVSTPANTDIWKKPPSHDVFTAPYKVHSSKPLRSFTSASITFRATYTLQFDQAGILLILRKPQAQDQAQGQEQGQEQGQAQGQEQKPGKSQERKWIKAGIEFFNGQPRLSTVCCDAWADWSVASLPSATASQQIQHGKESVTILVEKLSAHDGDCLWVYYVDGQTGDKVPMREIAWVFGHEDEPHDSKAGWQLEVAAAVARPAKEADGDFEARFEALDVTWAA